jgi:hypothetical protein
MFAYSFNVKFDRDGYLLLKNYYTIEKCNQLRQEMDNIIDSNNFLDEINKITGEKDEEKVFLSIKVKLAYQISNQQNINRWRVGTL